MNQRHILKLACVFALSLGVVGCNSGDDDPSDPGTPGDSTEPLIEPGANEAVLYYLRPDATYDGWGLHLWNNDACAGAAAPTDWAEPLAAEGVSDTYGAYYIIDTTEDASCLNFIMHKGDEKDLGGNDILWQFDELGRRVFTLSASSKLSSEPISAEPLVIEGASAHWVDQQTLLWDDAEGASRVELRYDVNARIELNDGQLAGGSSVELANGSLSSASAEKFPHLANWPAFEVPLTGSDRTDALKGQLVAAAYNADDELMAATRLQIPGVLDELFAYEGQLGATVNGSGVDFRVWAPTAKAVNLHVFDAGKNATDGYPVAMTADPDHPGVWTYSGPLSLDRMFYQYEVAVFHPRTDAIETTMTTDPYARSLSTNGQYAQVVDLEDSDLKPSGWDSLTPPTVANPEDIVVYETHIRDFSAGDASVSAEDRGKYAAFSEAGSSGVTHLQRLADAGITHLHLLPSFDIATVNEDPSKVVDIEDDFNQLCSLSEEAATRWADKCSAGTIRSVLASFDPATGDAQALYSTLRGIDSFNWGYDPVHYTVPEGSYASDADGTARILEFRQMVHSLTSMGFNVVLDVVYNHTNSSGLADKSVLDKLVPGYYHRQNSQTGAVEQSTCCENTASEHVMMEKLMIDSLVTWADQYGISGFRFDLMGHHMLSNMTKALEAVQDVDPDTYFYGEGWNFGEVANNARGLNAIQANLAGTGIGSFNDRSRDGVRGGGPFDGGQALRDNQGFANGLFTLPNELNSGAEDEKQQLLHSMDWIRVGIAGGLADFSFETADGNLRTGAEIDYNGQAAGYTADPQELVNYVSKHDNQTLWDNNQYKIASSASSSDRANMQVVGLSVPILGQGIPFLHMGSEILRSKSMQRDSYDSGDWFNAVDFSYQETAWNRGLPREDKDGDNWPVILEIIEDPNAEPTPTDILATRDAVETLLRIRKNSPLFRLQTGDAVKQRLAFHNTGPGQIPGVLAFSLDDGSSAGADLDNARDALMMIINATPDSQTVSTGMTGFSLHPQLDGNVAATFLAGDFVVPGLSVAVFEQVQTGAQGPGIPAQP
ncbi:pullulanase-type alpha-1,6-glucosidase [Marinobacter nanhaiticus D15-8W]|uniref:Pullulanase-type alpha-1,6-glucosidase n=1 Tax=Marinobacter nanhaiticus D15-8W TaxID=626887 RepID=N6WQ01_9GAMM|nr:pullulanase-type alpha-1,6-glucosidase [Marinobacter nanhaiticus]ENO13656.1 pullulanase-type alpha-1,6-glucosidase [Marinobacter nanhaiticus D15-8W]BES71027.1 pullulanase-type alpha-1,6-glucosidase [Marinobacter nanhaiticus D15-8W]